MKLEGGERSRRQIELLVQSGIPVMAHIGLTPQSVNAMGYRVQGRGEEAAQQLLRDAKAVQDAGAFAVVLELVPAELAAEVTRVAAHPDRRHRRRARDATPRCWCGPTWLGLTGGRVPKFVKQYADLRRDRWATRPRPSPRTSSAERSRWTSTASTEPPRRRSQRPPRRGPPVASTPSARRLTPAVRGHPPAACGGLSAPVAGCRRSVGAFACRLARLSARFHGGMTRIDNNPSGAGNAVTVRGLVKHYGETKALDGVDLDVRRGHRHGGARAERRREDHPRPDPVHPARPPTPAGRPSPATTWWRQPRQLRRVIGLTGQYASVDEKLSGWENLYMIGRLLDLSRKDARAARRRAAGAVLAHRGGQAARRARTPAACGAGSTSPRR